MAWHPGPGDLSQKCAKIGQIMTSSIKSQKFRNFQKMCTRRLPESTEGFNSSLALETDKLWPEMLWALKG